MSGVRTQKSFDLSSLGFGVSFSTLELKQYFCYAHYLPGLNLIFKSQYSSNERINTFAFIREVWSLRPIPGPDFVPFWAVPYCEYSNCTMSFVIRILINRNSLSLVTRLIYGIYSASVGSPLSFFAIWLTCYCKRFMVVTQDALMGTDYTWLKIGIHCHG